MITNYLVHEPILPKSAYIAENATVAGKVTLGEDVNVWFSAVIRGDVNHVSIGDRTNVQDNVTVHVADQYPCLIGHDVTIGHNAVVHACTIEDHVLIGRACCMRK